MHVEVRNMFWIKNKNVFKQKKKHFINFGSFQLTNDLSWIKSALQNLQVECQLQLERDVSIWEGVPKGPPANYTDLFCIAGCGGAGSCEKGRKILFKFLVNRISYKTNSYTQIFNSCKPLFVVIFQSDSMALPWKTFNIEKYVKDKGTNLISFAQQSRNLQ